MFFYLFNCGLKGFALILTGRSSIGSTTSEFGRDAAPSPTLAGTSGASSPASPSSEAAPRWGNADVSETLLSEITSLHFIYMYRF